MEVRINNWRFLVGGVLLVSQAAFSLTLPAPQFNIRTLGSVVQHTLQYNPTVLQMLARRYAAHADYQSALSGFMPHVFASFSKGKEESKNPLNNDEDITLTRTDQTIGITQPIFSGFSTYNLVKQRKAQYNAAEFYAKNIKETVARQTVQAYLDVLRFKKLHKLTLRNITAHREILAKVRMKYHGGAGRKTELDLARGRLAQRRVSLHAVIGASKQAATNFKQLVGFYPFALVEPVLPLKLPHNLAAAQLSASRLNPQLLAAKATLNAANAAVAASKGSFLPQVNVEMSKNHMKNAYGIKGSDHDQRAMVVVSYNIFSGGADSAAVDKAVAARYETFERYLEMKRAVQAAVANAWYVLETDRKQLKQDKIYVASVKKVLRGYWEQFSLGRRSLLNLVDMENEVFNARAAVINETYAVKYDGYRLVAAIGSLAHYFTN